MKRYFRPEFINRIDDIVLFSPLTEDQIIKIIDLSMEGDIQKEAGRIEGFKVTLTDATKRYIAKEAYSPTFGARPVKRYLKNILKRKSQRRSSGVR